MSVPETPAAKTAPTRAFGRYQLRQLLGKSDRSMVWLAFDPRASQEVMLTLPRVQPADAAGLEAWTRDAKLAARLDHPNLAHVIEVGVQDHWPYVAVDRALGSTLAERLAATPGLTANEAVGWMIQALEGLAFAHEAGVAHRDLQLHHVLLSEQGTVRVMALAVASAPAAAGETAAATEPTTARCRWTRTSCAPPGSRPSATCCVPGWCCTSCCAASRRSTNPTPPA
jgi:non-specific serine/threonine protein kinase